VSRVREGRLSPLDPRLLAAAPSLRRHVATLVPLVALRGASTVAAAVLLAHALAQAWGGEAPVGLLALAGLLILRALLDGLVDLLGAGARDRARVELRGAALAGLTAAGPLELGRRDPARIAHAVGPGLDVLDGYVTRVLPALVSAVVVPPLVLAWLARTDLVSTAILLVTLPLVPLFLVILGLTTRDRTARSYATLGRLAGRLLDLMQGLPTLKVHGRAAGQVAAVGRVAEQHRTETVRALRWAFLSGLAMDLIASLSVAVVALGAGLRLLDGALSLAPALVVLLLAPEVFAPLRAVGATYHASTDALESAAVALELAALPPLAVRGTLLEGEPVASLVDVSVRWPGRDTDALQAVSLSLLPGQVVSVQGPSGGGKSTLLQVLLGAVGADRGTVVTAAAGPVWRARLGWLPQRPRPSRDTVADEVRLGDPGATGAQVEAALLDCSAPDGATPLGEDGRAVSAGQRRRVALARVLLRARAVAARGEVPLVLLDEPSEDLDAAGERVVARVVDGLRGTATVVLVTHSATLADIADRAVRLAAGRIVHDEVRTPGLAPAPEGAALPERLGEPATSEGEDRWGVVDLVRALQVDAAGLQRRALAVVGIGTLAALAGLGLTGASAWLVLRAAEQPGVQVLAVATVAVRTCALGRALLRYAERLAAHDVALRLLARTRVRVVGALVPLAPHGLDLWRRGDVLRRFTSDVDAVQDAVVRGLLPVVSAATTGLAALVLTTWLAPPAVPALLVGLLLAGACAPLAALAGRRGAGAAARAAGARDRAAVAWVEAAPELWVLDAQAGDAARLRELDAEVTRRSRPVDVVSAVATAASSTAAALTPVAVLAVAAGQVRGLTAGVVTLLAVAAVEPVAALAPAWAALGTAVQRAGRVAQLLAAPAPVPEPATPAVAPAGDLGLVASVADLGYRANRPVLSDVDLLVAPGTRVAVVGPSGSGKSTLVGAALRLLRPLSGTVGVTTDRTTDVTADGVTVSLTDLPSSAVPALVSGCLQDDHMFATTLRENLRIGRPAPATTSSTRWPGDSGCWTGSGRCRRAGRPAPASTGRTCRAVSGSACCWRGCCSPIRPCSSSTNRPPTSTSTPSGSSWPTCSRPPKDGRCCCRRTGSTVSGSSTGCCTSGTGPHGCRRCSPDPRGHGTVRTSGSMRTQKASAQTRWPRSFGWNQSAANCVPMACQPCSISAWCSATGCRPCCSAPALRSAAASAASRCQRPCMKYGASAT